MAEKILQTRIQLKYDTYANWQSSTIVLKAGEIAIATIPSGTTGSGSFHLPAVMAKVGDGTHTFAQLDWLQSVAADIYDWAKASSKPSYGSNEISVASGNGVAATNVQAAIKELAESIGALTGSSSGSIADLITAEINKLDGNVTGSAGAGKTLTAFSQIDGKVTATFSNIAITKSQVTDFPTLGTASGATVETTGVASNTTTLPTTAQVKSYVDGAIGAINSFEYEVVSSLPTAAEGTMHKIYLIADTHGTNDSYDEYITLKSGSNYSWEKIGNTDINLSGYAKTTDIQALDGVITGSAGAGKTLTAFSQTDGKVTATFSDISIAQSQVSGLSTALSGKQATITDGSATIASVSENVVTLKAGVTQTSGAIGQATGSDITLAAIAKTGNVNDLAQTSGDVLVFNCGSSTINV